MLPDLAEVASCSSVPYFRGSTRDLLVGIITKHFVILMDGHRILIVK